MSTSYVPPKGRAAAEAAAIQNDPTAFFAGTNFPMLGKGVASNSTKPPLELLKRLKESEEERRLREEEAAAKKDDLLGKSRDALHALGWEVLSLSPDAVKAAAGRVEQ